MIANTVRTFLALLAALFLVGASALRLEINQAGGSAFSGGFSGLAWLLICLALYIGAVALSPGKKHL